MLSDARSWRLLDTSSAKDLRRYTVEVGNFGHMCTFVTKLKI
jgi:hypothetical protein